MFSGRGPRLPRLTVDCWVPTIITEYPSSLLNGKRLAKRRQAKIWLIIAHSGNNFIRSELPVWKSDMAGKEIGKWRKMWQKLRTILHKSTIALTLTSTVRVWRNRNLELHYTQIWCVSLNLVRTVVCRIIYCSILAWSRILSVMVWADFSPK